MHLSYMCKLDACRADTINFMHPCFKCTLDACLGSYLGCAGAQFVDPQKKKLWADQEQTDDSIALVTAAVTRT